METTSILLTILWSVSAIGIFIGWFWFVRKYLLRTSNFTCCSCRKTYPQKHETEKNLYRWCKEKKKLTYVLHS